jgi:hypothetical protein
VSRKTGSSTETWGRICHFAPPCASVTCDATGAQCLPAPPPPGPSRSFEAIAFLSFIPKIQVPICNRFYVNWIHCSFLYDKAAFFVLVAVASRKCAQMALMQTHSSVCSTLLLCCASILSVIFTFLFILASFIARFPFVTFFCLIVFLPPLFPFFVFFYFFRNYIEN